MIIDCHTHVWPDALAQKAVATITEFPVRGDGTVAGLVREQEASGTDASVCLFFALSPQHVTRVNEFAGTLDQRRLIPFGTVHPALSIEENLESLRRNGMRGVKVHPTFQGYRLDDPDLLELLAALAGEFPVLFHVGAGAGGDGSAAHPSMVRDIKRRIPDLTVIAAHFGGFRMLDESSRCLIGEDVYLDTSWPPSMLSVGTDVVRDVIRRHGVDRVLFASDWPTASQVDELRNLGNLGLDNEELRLIQGENMALVLGMADGE